MLKCFPQNLSDSQSHGILASPEVTARVQQSQNDFIMFEGSVREIAEAWERAKRSLRDNPNLKLERTIWRDFFAQPEILERNIQALKVKQQPS